MGGEEGGTLIISRLAFDIGNHLQLEGGTAADDEGTSSSGSLDRLRPFRADSPRLAADMLGLSGELWTVRHARKKRVRGGGTSLG